VAYGHKAGATTIGQGCRHTQINRNPNAHSDPNPNADSQRDADEAYSAVGNVLSQLTMNNVQLTNKSDPEFKVHC
jgi:hypothetical protein